MLWDYSFPFYYFNGKEDYFLYLMDYFP